MPARHLAFQALLFAASSSAFFAADRATASNVRAPTIYVLQDGGTIQVYHRARQWAIVGPDTGLEAVIDIKRQALGDLVVSNRDTDSGPGSIVTLPDGRGNVSATSIIQCDSFSPWGIGVDIDSNIWMTNYESNEVREYAATADGCPAPLAQISGTDTGLDIPLNVGVDRNGRIIVSNYLSGILIFAPGSNGNVSPVAKITNSRVINAHLEGMSIDRRNNIWLTSYANSEVMEFGSKAKGNDAPKRVISGPKTQLASPVGIAFDRKTGEIYVANYGGRAVLVFASDASGDVAPIRQFASGFDFGVAVK
jgi:DNA-binding beta-propeller fold protein YncE